MSTVSTDAARTDERGFGLVEIVVSMLLISIIAVAFLPLLVQTLVTSARNVTVATATQLVNDHLETARGQVTSCAELATFLSESVPAVIDSRGIELQPARSAGSCSDSVPGVVALTITVERTDDGSEVATATTLIYVYGS